MKNAAFRFTVLLGVILAITMPAMGIGGLSEVKSIITAILSIGQVQGDETYLAG